MTRLQGKVAIVTGAASGIGEAIARRFAADGAHVVAADVQDARGQALVAALGGEASYLHCDVSREDDVRALVAHAVQRHGRVDVMVNNAGSPGPSGPIENVEVEAFDAVIGVLLRGVFLGIKHAAPVMKRQGSGSIVSTASVAGLRTGFGPHVYSAAKAAVIHLTHSVAMELGESGVRVNCICPGGIATPIFGKGYGLTPEAADRSVPLMKQVLSGMQPLRRAGLPDDIANAAAWLGSDEASFVNGHALVVDGGVIGGRLWSELQQRREMMETAMRSLAG
ncbi:MAG TPA: glucose 1-dehydrogenase [Burkholderiaceae bacterium]|nr:glucose 1-dehydrogenase [Burkholderiaceae bacterium]